MDESLREKFGKRFKELRESRNLTRKDLASKANINLSFVSQLERGLKFISPESLEVCCKILDYPTKEFFNFDETKDDAIVRLIVNKLKSNPRKIKLLNRLIDAVLYKD